MLTATKYTDEARRSADFPLVERASELLAEIARTKYDDEPVTAEWDVAGRHRGRAVFRLRLSDSSGEASGTIAADRLEPPELGETRFLSIWGHLLSRRADRILAAMRDGGE
ncbi:MAG: hypothetical protein K2X87_26255 [Gemmataceae bacterium]|nr:hypothetical protein [Gemmataceae bacterium]